MTYGGELIYNDNENVFYRYASYENYDAFSKRTPLQPGEIDTEDYEEIDLNNIIKPNYVVKVRLTLFPKSKYNQDPIVLSRSYIPQYSFID
ncbi:hypothetical protein [Myroides odoratimimus]|uniref:hypothetical protein n=1 Tax=Myroides odoratimimus TaxID=76832 RepID=UPI00046A78A0|nr:hypothetical protein [Myroides odoratimimus]